jgi:hypothetical protein
VFGTDFFNPETVWINLTNLTLGIVTLACVLAVAWGVAAEVLVRLRKRAESLIPADDHAFAVPGLGLTMADGGEKIEEEKKD